MIPRLGAITWPDKRKWGYEGREYERVSVGKRSTALWEIRLASLPARKFNIRIDVRAGWREPVSFHSRLSGLCRSFLTPFILIIFHCMCIYRRIYRVSIYIYWKFSSILENKQENVGWGLFKNSARNKI